MGIIEPAWIWYLDLSCLNSGAAVFQKLDPQQSGIDIIMLPRTGLVVTRTVGDSKPCNYWFTSLLVILRNIALVFHTLNTALHAFLTST